MKKLKTYNESVKDYLKSKISKEEVIQRIMDEPSFARMDYILDNGLDDLFTQEEIHQFEKQSIFVDYSESKILFAETNDKIYYIITNDGNDDNPYIFDDDWNKLSGEMYDNIKWAVELMKLRLGN